MHDFQVQTIDPVTRVESFTRIVADTLTEAVAVAGRIMRDTQILSVMPFVPPYAVGAVYTHFIDHADFMQVADGAGHSVWFDDYDCVSYVALVRP